uniref:Peptidase S1 domain-containing protein n=1 Tax=Stomoxys calcitrans TaxID=35570 RepID=A0A1I8PR75_STOCA
MRVSLNFLIAITIITTFGTFSWNSYSVGFYAHAQQNNGQNAGMMQNNRQNQAQNSGATQKNNQKNGMNQNNAQKNAMNQNNAQKGGGAQNNAQKNGMNQNNNQKGQASQNNAQKNGMNQNNAQKNGMNQNNAQKNGMNQNNAKKPGGAQNNAHRAQTNAQKFLLNQINRQMKRGLAQLKHLQRQVQKNIKRPTYNANKSVQFAKPKKPKPQRQQNFVNIYKRLDKKVKVDSQVANEGKDEDDDEDDEEEIEATNDDFDGRSIVTPGEYPHMGALGFPAVDDLVEFKCGGSLISASFVLTAAHCCYVIGDAPVLVKFGIINLKEEAGETEMPQNRTIAEVIVHPLYNTSMHYHDIALLRLQEPIFYTRFVRPIRLWARDDIPYDNVFTMGYGSTSFAKAPTYILTEMELSTVSQQECNVELPPNEIAPQGITETQICAKDFVKNRDTCQGDSGGPLQLNLKRRRNRNGFRYYLVGIISYGEVCGSGSPGVYTRVSSYVDWIASIVWPDEFQNF